MLRPPLPSPEPAALRHGATTALCLSLVAQQQQQPIARVRRDYSVPALEYATAQIVLAYAQDEAQRRDAAGDDLPAGDDLVSRIIAARMRQLQAQAKVEEDARLAARITARTPEG